MLLARRHYAQVFKYRAAPLSAAAKAARHGEAAAQQDGNDEAEYVVLHASGSGRSGKARFCAAVNEAAEENFVFGALVRHLTRITGCAGGEIRTLTDILRGRIPNSPGARQKSV